jgi:hypothetical protein
MVKEETISDPLPENWHNPKVKLSIANAIVGQRNFSLIRLECTMNARALSAHQHEERNRK